MKIVCQRENLLAAFQTAVLFTPGRSTPKDVLSHIRLEAQADKVTLQATDLDTGAIVQVEGVDVQQPGAALLPSERLGSLLRESTDAQLGIHAGHGGVTVRSEHGELRFNTREESEFPTLPSLAEDKYHLIDGRVLRTVIQRTEFATDMESTRYALGGVLFELEPDKLVAVATDGRRLSKVEAAATAVGGHSTGELTTIVRAASLRAIARALTDADNEIRMTVRASDVVFSSPRAAFFSRLIEGRFPRWRDVLPKRPSAAGGGASAGGDCADSRLSRHRFPIGRFVARAGCREQRARRGADRAARSLCGPADCCHAGLSFCLRVLESTAW
jgi:DNA polymerase-3 subunit beta